MPALRPGRTALWSGERQAAMPSNAYQDDHARERVAVEAACARARIDSRGMYLMRRHANAIYHLPRSGAVARVRDIGALDALSAAVRATGWLAAQDFPAAQPLDIAQPITVASFAVTLWRYLPALDGARPTSADLAMLPTRIRLHAHLQPPPPVPASGSWRTRVNRYC
jgi:glutathione S-transferase